MNPEIDNILARYFSGEANDKDMAVLDTWLAESEANEQVFEQMTLLFEKAAPFSTSQQPNTGKALQLFKEYMQQPEKNTRRFTLRNYLYWSAAAVLVMAVTLTVFHLQPNETTIQVAATATTETIILPDSSIVTIAPGSRISYNKDFGVQERRVQLTGKATFDAWHRTIHCSGRRPYHTRRWNNIYGRCLCRKRPCRHSGRNRRGGVHIT